MGYRDEAEAMHARMRALEDKLESARQRGDAAEAHCADREALAARVRALEAELEALRVDTPPEPPEPPEPEPGSAPATGFVPPSPRPVKNPSKAMSWYRDAAGWFGLIASIIVAGLYLVGLDWCGVDLEGDPTEATVHTAEESTARRAARVSGTTRAEELFHPRCRGFLPEAPMVVIDADQAARLTLRVVSSRDAVMVLRMEDGEFVCDNGSWDRDGLLIEATVESGQHRVWVGTREQAAQADVELFVESESP